MNKTLNNIELLAPAGSFDTLKSAVNAGADAVYIGGSMFSARASATNFDNDNLINAIDYCHSNDVKVYIAVNTLIKDIELKDCVNYIAFLYEIGADAVIVQDIGLATIIRQIFPKFHLHLSTQSTISSIDDIHALSSLDIQRIVLPRETNIDEIKIISENTNIEIEAFVHGAICVSYSGKCLFSALNGGRSGNRGACTQVCRKKYILEVDKKVMNDKDSMYVLSPKDLNTSSSIDKILDSGVTSLKIEGRMKRKEYIYVAVKSYRQLVDEYLEYGKISKQNIENANYNLQKVFNRSFTQGYILNQKGKNIINNSYQKPIGEVVGKVLDLNKKEKRLKIKLSSNIQKGDGLDIGESIGRIIKSNGKITDSASKGEIIFLDFIKDIEKNRIIRRTYDYAYEKKLEDEQKETKKLPISAKIVLKLNQNPYIILKDKDIENKSTIDFDIQSSKNSPISDDTIIKQISKTDTFPFKIYDIEIEKDDNIFIPVKILNQLRRTALEDFYNQKINRFKRKEIAFKLDDIFDNKNVSKNDDISKNKIDLFVFINNEKHIDFIKKYEKSIKALISSDINIYKKINNLYKEKSVFALPNIVRQEDSKIIENMINSLDNPKLMFSTYSFADNDNAYIANYHLNIYNSFTHKYYNDKNIYTIASLENIFANSDTYEYIKDKSKIIIPTYIYPQLMLTEFCPHKDDSGKCIYNYKCKLPQTAIINEQGDRFLFEKFLNCKTAILSDKPYLIGKSDIKDYVHKGYSNFIIELKNEDEKDINAIFSRFL